MAISIKFDNLVSRLFRWEKRKQFAQISEFPKQVDIEPTNTCNLNCIHCPLPNSLRKIGYMNWDLLKKITEEIFSYHIDRMCMGVFGEPLLHPKFPQMAEYVKRYGNIKYIHFETNGLLLNEEKAQDIVRSQLDKMIVSIDGATKKTYESIRRNGDFDLVVNNIKSFIKIRERMKSIKPTLTVQIIKMKETVNEIDQFRRFWQPLIKKTDQIDVKEYWTWGGAVAERTTGKKDGYVIKIPCVVYLWSNLAIYWNGDAACCVDCDGDTIVGNVRESTIKEIWHGRRLQDMRRLHLAGKLDSLVRCRSCEYVRRELKLSEIITNIPRHIYQASKYFLDGSLR